MLSRIKFEITPLVNKMLDQLPSEVWTSTTTTFFDPAIAGGQFVREIERRLLEAGHSRKNVSGRVFGCEEYEHQVQYALNKYKLLGNYAVTNFLEQDFNMKFDVIVGNPPYQSGNGESGGKHSLWRKFVKKSFELGATDGYVLLVCPGFPYQANDIGRCFTENTPLVLNNDASSYFPGIGSEIKYWIVKQGNHNLPFVVDGQVWTPGLDLDPTLDTLYHSIIDKINKFDKFEYKQDRGYNSTQFKNDNKDYFDTPIGESIYPIRHASTVKVCYVKAPTECHSKRKVMMTFSGYPAFEYYSETTPMSSCYQMSGYIEVANKKEAISLIELYQSELYSFLSNFNSSGMKGAENYCLPKLDLTRTWTDTDIYKEFKLTNAEIEYIQSNI